MDCKVLIADDHPITRARIRAILEMDDSLEIIGEATVGSETIQRVGEQLPDIIVMDVSMLNTSGIETTQKITERSSDVKILALSRHTGEKFVKGMLDAGAMGYILEDEAQEELIKAIRKINKGEMYLSSGITKTALGKDEGISDVTNALVLQTKLYKPRLFPEYVQRTEIIQELQKNVGKPFSLVSAGAGYGKSMCVSQWLEQTEYINSWITLDQDHNNLRLFLLYLASAVEKVFPKMLSETFRLASASNLPSVKEIYNIVLNDLCNIDLDFILVLDDYHNITNNQIHELFNQWLQFPPPNIHLCLLTRFDPPIDFYPLQLKGRMTEIRMNDLIFRHEEIRKLYQRLINIDLDKQTIDLIKLKTEGWVMALRLVSLIMEDRKNIDQVLSSLDNEMLSISENILSEVIMSQPADFNKALLISSLFDRFCVDLLDALRIEGVEISGKELIQWINKLNLFVTELDSKENWFRYHHLFQSMMQKKLVEYVKEEDIQQAHRSASIWFERNELYEEAMDHALSAEDYSRGIQIILKNKLKLLNKGSWVPLENLISKLPEKIMETHAELLLVKTYLCLMKIDLPGMIQYLGKVDQLEAESENFNQQPYYGEYLFYKAYFKLFAEEDVAESFELFRIPMKTIPESHAGLRGTMEMIYSMAAQMLGKYEETRNYLIDRVKDQDSDPMLRSWRYLAFLTITITAAALDKVEEYHLIALEEARDNNLVGSRSLVIYGCAMVNLFKGDIEKAIPYLLELVDSRYESYTAAAVDGFVALILSYQLLNEPKKSLELIDKMETYIHDLNPYYKQYFWAARVRYNVLIQNREVVNSMIGKEQLGSLRNPTIYFEIPVNTEIRALILEGSKEQINLAEEKLNELISFIEKQHNILYLIELLVHQAILYDKMGRREESINSLMRAAALAEPGKLKIFFIEMGDQIKKIISRNTELLVHPYLQEIFDTINSIPFFQSKNLPQHNPIKNNLNTLTQREREVLICLNEGLRNKEIADKLFLSLDSVKKHIYHMFQKFDVKNRMSLVMKAKEGSFIDGS